MQFVSFVLIIVSLSTTGWFVSYQEQKTFSLAQDVLWRQIDFRMSYEGLKVHIQFCPQVQHGATMDRNDMDKMVYGHDGL